MKFLALLFLLGFASASLRDVLDDAADEVLKDYVEAMELNPSLKTYMKVADETEDDVKTELGKRLREHLDRVLEKIKEAIDKKQEIKEDLIEKAKEIREQLKDLNVKVGEKAKEVLQKIKERLLEKGRDFWNKLREKLGLKDKDDELEVKRIVDIREGLRDLKRMILDNFNKEEIKKKIEALFGRFSVLTHQFLDMLKDNAEKAKEKMVALIDRMMGKDEEDGREIRSLKELWEKVKDYFKDLHIDLKEKYLKFGEWVKEFVGDRLEKGKSKLENLKQIARELIDHAKVLKKEVVVETLEFFRPYKEDLGTLWDDLKNKMTEVLNRKDN